jgi:hypothetical protein
VLVAPVFTLTSSGLAVGLLAGRLPRLIDIPRRRAGVVVAPAQVGARSSAALSGSTSSALARPVGLVG